eukprot:318033-Prymnesium_polylepis.1
MTDVATADSAAPLSLWPFGTNPGTPPVPVRFRSGIAWATLSDLGKTTLHALRPPLPDSSATLPQSPAGKILGATAAAPEAVDERRAFDGALVAPVHVEYNQSGPGLALGIAAMPQGRI